MYVFKTTSVIDSKVCADVKFVVRKMTENRRDELRLKLASPLAEIEAKLDIAKQLEGKTDEDSQARRASLYSDVQTVINTKINGIKIEWGIKAVKNLAIDNEDAVADIQDWRNWPSELVAEAVAIVDNGSGMTVEETKNSESPITSGEVMGIVTSDTSAPPVEKTESILAEIAHDFSQSS